MRSRIVALLASIVAWQVLTGTVRADIAVNALDRGFYTNTGIHVSGNENTFTGRFGSFTDRSFFVFDLTALSGQSFDAAKLRLTLDTYTSAGDAFRTFDAFDVLTSTPTLLASQSSATGIYDDLGTGDLYGTATVSSNDVNTVIEIDLSNLAVADINAALGSTFAIGARLRPLHSPQSGFISFGDGTGGITHQLVLIPVPGSILLGVLGLGAVSGLRRRRAL